MYPYKVIGGDNNNMLLNINGHIVPASVDKIKTYSATKSHDLPPSSSNNSNRKEVDSLLDCLIAGKVFFLRFRASLNT